MSSEELMTKLRALESRMNNEVQEVMDRLIRLDLRELEVLLSKEMTLLDFLNLFVGKSHADVE